MSDRHQIRRDKLLRVIRQQGLEALLVSGEKNVRWLTGFTGDSSWLLLGSKICLLISDGRYTTQIDEECPGLDVSVRPITTPLVEAAAEVVQSAGVLKLGVEGHLLSIVTLRDLSEQLPDVEFSSVPAAVEELRAIKDAEEIAEIRLAVRLAQRGFEVLKATLTPESTEVQISHDLEHAMRRFGAEGVSFPPIIAADDRAALPHYHPSHRPIGGCSLLLVDWGAEPPSRYKSDLTRVLILSRPSKKLQRVYDVVLKAQLAGIARIRPGVKCSEVDEAAREVIAKAGFGSRFGHGLGHGVGLDIHEQPRFAPNSETLLQPGMVVTVEPGIYLPGWGGVRIEDDILVTREGCEVLSADVPKDFESALVDYKMG